MWRTTPMHRSEVAGQLPGDGPPELPPGALRHEVQHPPGGSGPLFHRVYRARIRAAQMAPEELMARVSADPDRVAPTEFAAS
jgi:hypothetical protein